MLEKKTAVEKCLEKLEPDTRLKVGAKSSYFYCGTAGDFSENMDEYSSIAYRRAEKKVRTTKAGLKNLLVTNVSPSDYAAQNIRNGTMQIHLSAQGYMEYLDDFFKEVERRVKAKVSAEQSLSHFAHMRDRDVVRFEKSTLEKNCFILVLSGDEVGSYWELSDADASPMSFTSEEAEDD